MDMMSIRRRMMFAELQAPEKLFTVTGNPITFSTDMTNPLEKIKIDLAFTQSGSGTASPDNERPITGLDGITLTANGTQIPVSWQADAGTVYGGYVDLVTGELVVTYAGYVDSGGGSWTRNSGTSHAASSSWRFEHSISGAKSAWTNTNQPAQNAFCNYLKVVSSGNLYSAQPDSFALYSARMYVRITNISEVTDLKAYFALHPLAIVYPLATPVAYQLTPQQINTIIGTNTLSANVTGDMEVQYWSH